ncbi:MAG TPA: SdrD B-like domain-containing protein [Tepidisphaeraceae bacterium]|jgi:hypothetical protein
MHQQPASSPSARSRSLQLRSHFQTLEQRTLLSAAINGAADRLDPALLTLASNYQTHQSLHPSQPFAPQDHSLRIRDGAVQMEFQTIGSGKTLYNELKKLNLHSAGQTDRSVWGWLPINQINKVVNIPGLSLARASRPMTAAGSVTTQTDKAARADLARTLYAYTGTGIKVGILSDSFNTSGIGSYSADVASGDLPSGIQILSDYTGGSDEGRAMAQLVYDTAPGVSIAFATAFNGMSSFASNIKALRDAGCKVIIDDVFYLDEPMFQDSQVAQAIDDVVSSGVAYFSAAGNKARQAYDSVFRSDRSLKNNAIPSDVLGLTLKAGTSFDFDPSTAKDDLQQFTLGPNQTMQLSVQWDQPYGSIPGSATCATELDVYVLNSDGSRIVGGTNATNIGGDPVEYLAFTNSGSTTGTYNLMIVKRTGAAPGEIKYLNFNAGSFTEFNTYSGSLFGHSNSATGASVGAAAWYSTPAYGVSTPVLESYSSAGSTNILFSSTGTRLSSATVRQHPNFTAPDGGNTTFFSSDSGADSDSYPNFFGTSAAAPTAGAVAALMLCANGSLTPSQIYTALQNSTVDMDDASTAGFDTGFDWASGYGLIRADVALASIVPVGTISGVAFEDRDSDAVRDAGELALSGVTVFLDTNNNSSLDTGETSTATLSDGSYSFTVAPGTYNVRQVTPANALATDAGSHGVTVTGGSTNTGPSLGSFPTIFTGTSFSDVYLVAADPSDPSRIQVTSTLNGSMPVVYSIAQSRVAALTFNAGSGNDSMSITGPLTTAIVFNGATGNDTLSLNGGAFTFNTDLRDASSNLTLNVTAATVTFGASQHLAAMNLLAGASVTLGANGNRFLQTAGLAIAPTAALDLNDNDIIVEYTGATPFELLQQWVLQGYADSPTAGKNGIVSSTGQQAGNTILSLVDSAFWSATEWPIGSGNAVPPNAVFGKYTYFGDSDLNGTVSPDDYIAIDSNLGNTSPVGAGFTFGDFNFDGAVTPDDYLAIDSNLGSGSIIPL